MKKIITAVLAAALLICIVCGAMAESFSHSSTLSVPVRYMDAATPYTQNKTVVVAAGTVPYSVTWTEFTSGGKVYKKPTGGSYDSSRVSVTKGALATSAALGSRPSVSFTPSGDNLKVSCTSYSISGNRHTEGYCTGGKYTYVGSTSYSITIPAKSTTIKKKLK